MPANPVTAGRKGGSRNTPAQNAARKRNGFQKVNPAPVAPAVPCARPTGLLTLPKEPK
jgi:hypothetical protein